MAEDTIYIAKCRELIEQKVRWGDSAEWQTRDFENLSKRIFEETEVMLSSTTLKRIWGKVRYNSVPTIATLDALARFINKENWRAFTAAEFPTEEVIQTPISPVAPKRRYSILIGLAVALILLAIIYAYKQNKDKRLEMEDISFSSKPVTQGLPNTVIFEYDVKHSNADSVFIQQSWDTRKRYKVDKQLHQYTSTYYYPGYFKAKLILNDSIVKEHDLYIETNGWLGIIETQPIPVYLPNELLKTQLALTKDHLIEHKIDFQKEAPVVSLTNVSRSMNVSGNSFSLEVLLQNTYTASNAICQYSNVRVFGTEGTIDIPLCKIGCVGEIGLMLGSTYIDGKTTDLSGFGVDFSKEVKLNCSMKNKRISIYVNDSLVYSGKFEKDIGKLVGKQVRFQGSGTVKRFELK